MRRQDLDLGEVPVECPLEIIEGVSLEPIRPEQPHFRIVAGDKFDHNPALGEKCEPIADFVQAKSPVAEDKVVEKAEHQNHFTPETFRGRDVRMTGETSR